VVRGGVPYDTSNNSNSVKKIGKVLPRSLESANQGGGTPLEHERGAGKNRGKIGDRGTPSFSIGQPGILVEMTGVTQPISIKQVTHVISVKSYLSCGRGLSRGNKWRGSPPNPLVYAQDFLRGRLQRETLSLGGTTIIIIIFIIKIDHVTLLTCWECLLWNFDQLPCGGNDSMLTGRNCRLIFQGKATSIKVAGSSLKEKDCWLIDIAGSGLRIRPLARINS